ncbi:DUF3850 domain-containing protein [Cellulosilyticum sp. ST5]|uniref:DUF3850 domain-containing protein n=1 Tax=Cellulosilyticum sp. ST5 TaxID=3055805 RepID=UPI0039772688
MISLPRTLEVHQLKTVQPYFDDIWMNGKNFEVRKNDRNFKKGDVLLLLEYEPENANNAKHGYTGRFLEAKVTYVLDSKEYCKDGYVILGIKLQESN